jgi:glycerate 2-kinase
MKNVLVVPDKFKGSLNALQVCEAIRDGLLLSQNTLAVTMIPLADGGEGTCELLTRHVNGRFIEIEVLDPLQRKIQAKYGVTENGETAFIEMASASGLGLLRQDERNPLKTTTFGTGMMIRHAVESGAKKIILGIGGSATNDAGIGMATALGYSFYTREGKEVMPSGENLNVIDFIREPAVNLLADVKVSVLCDVNNPLYGETGAAIVFGPQKGADETTVSLLDNGLRNFAEVVRKQFGTELNFPGSGAAGGMGAGAKFFLDGFLYSGIDFVMDFVSLEERIKKSDLIITGEGRLDQQSVSGKVIDGVSSRCRKSGKPFWIICGHNTLEDSALVTLGATKVITLTDHTLNQEIAIRDAYSLITDLVCKETESDLNNGIYA